MKKTDKVLLKITPLNSPETLMYQGINLYSTFFLLLLLLNIYITKNINI